MLVFFFFSSRRRHTRWNCDWSSDVCSSDLSLSARRSKFGTYRYHSDGELVEFARRTAGTRLHKETDCPRRALQGFCLASWRSSASAAVGGAAGNEAKLSKTYPRAAISSKLFRYRPSISSASAEMSEVLPC